MLFTGILIYAWSHLGSCLCNVLIVCHASLYVCLYCACMYMYSIVLHMYSILLNPLIMCFYSACMDVLKMMQLREKHVQQFGVIRQTREWWDGTTLHVHTYKCTHVHTHRHTHTHTYTHTSALHILTHMHTFTHAHTHIHSLTHIHTRVYTHTHTHTHTHSLHGVPFHCSFPEIEPHYKQCGKLFDSVNKLCRDML